jgi:hypothetical protein
VPISNILIQDNLLAGATYSPYCQQLGAGTNFRVIDNHFSAILYRTWASSGVDRVRG